MAIRLIGIDVDGTLLDSRGQMPDVNREAIHDAVAAGIAVALVTGRSYPFARPVAEGLPEAITLIVSNGAIERGMDGRTLARRLLSREAARVVLEATRPYRNAAALVFDRDAERQVVFETMDWEHPNRKGYWSRNRSHIAQCVPLETALVEDPIQVMFNGGVEEMRVVWEALDQSRGQGSVGRGQKLPADPRLTTDNWPLAPDLSALDFAVSLTEYEHRDFSLIDITAPTATKGRALAWRAEQMGVARDEVMAVGDNFNDLEMLEFAGLPIVMGNAVAPLRERGWHVTGHQDEGGLAQAIRQYAL
jgi:hypothetical protein